MKPVFEMLAGYNELANSRLFDAAAGLADVDYHADHGAFFGSVHGTLNHLLVGDRVWMHRFTGEGPLPTRLDEILYDDFAGLRAAREAEDARIAAYVASLGLPDLDGTIRYCTISKPTYIEQELKLALLHVFNHQTHHRGQVHCLLTRITDAAPSLDLILYQRRPAWGWSAVRLQRPQVPTAARSDSGYDRKSRK